MATKSYYIAPEVESKVSAPLLDAYAAFVGLNLALRLRTPGGGPYCSDGKPTQINIYLALDYDISLAFLDDLEKAIGEARAWIRRTTRQRTGAEARGGT